MAGGYEVADLINQALDSIGWAEMVGDPEEGTHHAQVALRQYRTCRQQLLQAALWDFAMRQAPLTLLADASGNTADAGNVVPLAWLYEYAWPTDALRIRYIPWNLNNPSTLTPQNNIQLPQTPLVTGIGQLPPGARIIPAKFRVSTDYNYPVPGGTQTTDVMGVSPQGRTVVLCNVKQVQAVYTADMLYPSVWDPLFREALVAYLGAQMAVPIWSKKDQSQKTGIAARDRLIPIVKDKLTMARVANGNGSGTSSSDIAVDWMRARYVGGIGSYANWGPGGWGSGEGGGFGWAGDSLMISGGATL